MERFERRESAPTVFLEKASQADIEALIQIEQSVERTKVYSPMLTEKGWQRELSENEVYFIKTNNLVVGSIAYAEKSPERVYISGIIVIPQYQGKGIATDAMRQVMAKYPAVARIDLVTHPENPALKLYQSLGFKVEDKKENYFGDGEPRLVLALVREQSSIPHQIQQ